MSEEGTSSRRGGRWRGYLSNEETRYRSATWGSGVKECLLLFVFAGSPKHFSMSGVLLLPAIDEEKAVCISPLQLNCAGPTGRSHFSVMLAEDASGVLAVRSPLENFLDHVLGNPPRETCEDRTRPVHAFVGVLEKCVRTRLPETPSTSRCFRLCEWGVCYAVPSVHASTFG